MDTNRPFFRRNTLGGRLVVLPSKSNILNRYNPQDPASRNVLSDTTYIEFPAMPDQFELKRAADYMQTTSYFLPDGIHFYERTQPLTIPFEFRLHHADREYCTYGPKTLLLIAARLHALVLPVSADNNLQFEATTLEEFHASQDTPSLENKSGPLTTADRKSVRSRLNPPVVCQLELMTSGADDRPGIVCRGYVSQVSVVFKGPWLRGQDGSMNLPTAAEYSFTFVHRPGHYNVYNLSSAEARTLSNPQAFATTVKDRLYHTRHLAQSISAYAGFNTEERNQPAEEVSLSEGPLLGPEPNPTPGVLVGDALQQEVQRRLRYDPLAPRP